MPNPVGWFEVSGPDASARQRFYRETFGWEFDASNPMNYGMVTASEGGIGGGVGPAGNRVGLMKAVG
jgi:predicted enzyme related to lactoylglutathione lyase